MKYFSIALISLFNMLMLQPLSAEPTDIDLKYDKVSIGYIPSRGTIFQGEPYKVLEARTLAKHKNKNIEALFIGLNTLALEGITDNTASLHVPVKYIEVISQGRKVRLFYAGESNLEKFKKYENQWNDLHSQLYEYLSRGISPNKAN